MSRVLSMDDVSIHVSHDDLFTVIHNKVYNISYFINSHPGGKDVLLDVGGKDATEQFEDVGHSDEARETLEEMLVGQLRLPENQEKDRAAEQADISFSHSKDRGTQPIVWLNYLLACAVSLCSILAVWLYR